MTGPVYYWYCTMARETGKMRMRLAFKIFLAFFASSLTVVVLMTGIMGYFVRHGFQEFVNRGEMEKLSEVVSKLSDAYRSHHGWEFIRDDPSGFRHLIHPDFPGRFPGGMHPDGPEGMDHDGPMDMHRPPDHDPGMGLPDRGPPVPFMEGRIALFDQGMRVVAGRAGPSGGYILKEISVDGKTVGWLGLRKRGEMSLPLEKAFLYDQAQAFLVIGVAALLLSALASFLLSRHLLGPVGRLAEGARDIASRKFDTRISVDTGDELGQLAHDFNLMAQTLERYEWSRRQWISDISHELRTPIAILRGEIEAIQDGVRQADEGALRSLHAETMRLGSLVEDLRELSLADSGNLSMKLEDVSPGKVLGEALKAFELPLSQAGITVEQGPFPLEDALVKADGDRLFRVFTNVLENTLRYTEAPGRLKVWQEAGEGTVRIVFEDSEPGVPDGALEKIFDRLFRLEGSRSRAHGGTGLGLAICRGVVESFGGGIMASRSSLGGLRIDIELPLHRPGA
jgi:two-component system, OmpR family, sensor histidine kinase BaeS